jgi:hypothetical protein
MASRKAAHNDVDKERERVARRIASAHYEVDPDVQVIHRLFAKGQKEAGASEPIKLLEVHGSTSACGVVPVFLPADASRGITLPCIVVEVTPKEFESVRRGQLVLPRGWVIGERYERPRAAAKAG